jgi:hypothetical protein
MTSITKPAVKEASEVKIPKEEVLAELTGKPVATYVLPSLEARRALGVGRPAPPETPQRNTVSKAVPDVVLQESTPERAPAAVCSKRITSANGEHPLAHKW